MEKFSCIFMPGDTRFQILKGSLPEIFKKLKKRLAKDPLSTWGELTSKGEYLVKEYSRSLSFFERLIPEGMYCYTYSPEYVGCPFWSLNIKKPKQNNGHCGFMGRGDWQESYTSLLWDQCKECGINNQIEEDYE